MAISDSGGIHPDITWRAPARRPAARFV